MWTFAPSRQPRFSKPSRHAVSRRCVSGLSPACAHSTPIRRILPDCWARAASGHAVEAPPRTPRNSRRLMSAPGLRTSIVSAQTRTLIGAESASLLQHGMLADVRDVIFDRIRRFMRCPLIPRQRPDSRHRFSSAWCQYQQPRGRYSITASARSKIEVGNSMPTAFAVLRLTTNSNLLGCSTGRSAGLAPRSTLAT